MNVQCSQKTVLITGASTGIGKACAEAFALAGARLILCARNEQGLQALQQQLEDVESHLMLLDVSDQQAVAQAFAALPAEWRDIDILVNNAGLALGMDTIQHGQPADWDVMIDINVKGVLYVTQCVLQSMLARNTGHIVNLGSISGYQVYSGGAVYCATKFAVRALSDGIKMDVHGSKIRVTEIDPGVVKTNFSMVRFGGDKKRAEAVYSGIESLMPEDIADAVLYCVTRPAHVDVRVMKIYPTAQTAAHLLHRDNEE